VLVEKPFANNAQDAAQMVAAARASGKLLIEGSTTASIRCSARRWRRCAAARSGASSTSMPRSTPLLPGHTGQLRYIEELGGGALMDLGCYCLHWIRTVANDEPTVVTAPRDCVRPGSTSPRGRPGLHQRADRAR
jgi:predicted dehydrogenase